MPPPIPITDPTLQHRIAVARPIVVELRPIAFTSGVLESVPIVSFEPCDLATSRVGVEVFRILGIIRLGDDAHESVREGLAA